MRDKLYQILSLIVLNTSYGYAKLDTTDLPALVFSLTNMSRTHQTEDYYEVFDCVITLYTKTKEENETLTNELLKLDYTKIDDKTL